jgi:hypothetical protein
MPETYDAEVSGEFDDVVRQVSEYAETAQTAADNAGASASAAAASADSATASASAAETAKNAAETAQGKAEDAQAAAETAAQTATEKAQQTAQDAAQAAQSKADAESAAQSAEAAQTGAESAKTDAETAAQDAVASALAASASATSAGQAAASAAQFATAAAQSAASIEGDVQIASQKAAEAQTATGQAVAAKDAAVTAQQGAEAAETNAGQSASTASTKAAEAAQSASNAAQSKTDAEAAAARAEQAAASLTVDSALSDTSTNPVQNKVITGEVTQVKSAISDQLAEITVGKGTLVPNEYVKYDTGEFLPYGGWSRTGYLPCNKYTQIKLSTNTQYCAFYDSEHGYVKRANFVANTYLDVPENAAYFAISGTTNALSAVVINAMAKGLEYILNEKMDEVNDTIITEKTMSSDTLMDGYVVGGNGRPIASLSWVCTELIDMPFDETTGYYIHGTFYSAGGTAIYNKDGQVLLAITGGNVAEYGGVSVSDLQTIHVPYVEGAKTIRISGWKTKVSDASALWIKGNTFNGAYEHIFDIENKLKPIEANVSTTISQSKVLVMGDSISTDAYGSYKKWVTDLIEEGFFPSDTTNSSQHATGFVARYNSQPNDFITRIKAIENPSQYDLVVVFGGINDYIQNVPMGEETGTDYTVSFKPAVNEFFNYLIQNFTQARLCVLLPLRNYQNWRNSVGEYQQSYAEYIKTVAKKYCLPVLNLTEDSGFCPYIATFSDMWTLLPDGFQSHDGVHPNEEYERRFLAPMIKHFLQGML